VFIVKYHNVPLSFISKDRQQICYVHPHYVHATVSVFFSLL
jgi:hypothetical protein